LPWVFLGDGQTWTTITPDEFGTTWDWGEHGKGEIGQILSADIDGDHLTVVFEARWGNDAEESGIAVASWGPDGPSTTVSRPRTPLPSALGYAHVVRHDAGIAVLASTRNVAGAVAQVVQWQLDASSWMASDVTS